ncbi:MAG TPA: O-antigen ligase family protein, partial [Candidatus Limnocylindrales bacterium]|nr:O-antigen ligase family protein [Candidatus Limnocylindrales bacterium]
ESLPMRLSYLGLFATAVWLLKDAVSRDWLVAGFVVGTCIAALEAVQQWQAHVAFRPDGNLGNANLLAALVAMAVPLAAGRALRRGFMALAWAAGAVVLVAGLLVTTSRSGGLGVMAGCLALLTLAVPRRFGPAVGAVSAGLVVAAVLVILASPLRGLNDDPASLRLNLWQDGLRLIAARPLTGWGEDATGLVFGHYLSRDYASLVTFDRVHSGPLDVAATQGVLGLAALGWVLFVLLRSAWRHRDAQGVAPLAAALAGYSVWVAFNFDWAPATGVWWLLAGTLWAGLPPHPDPPRQAGRGSPWRLAIAVSLVVAAVVFAVFPLLADVWYLKGRSDLAVRVDPLQAQYHWAIGTLPELRRAAELGETTPDLYVQLGDAEARAGDRAAARRAYERALEIDPYFTPASQRLAALGG